MSMKQEIWNMWFCTKKHLRRGFLCISKIVHFYFILTACHKIKFQKYLRNIFQKILNFWVFEPRNIPFIKPWAKYEFSLKLQRNLHSLLKVCHQVQTKHKKQLKIYRKLKQYSFGFKYDPFTPFWQNIWIFLTSPIQNPFINVSNQVQFQKRFRERADLEKS